MNYFQLAYRNIKRHRRRSMVTVFIIVLGFIALGVIGGILNNIFSRLREQAIVNEKLGHITIVKKGFFENSKTDKENYLFNKQELDGAMKIIKANPEVTLATPRLEMFGVVSSGDASTIFISEATIPADDRELQKTNIDGRKSTGNNIFLGTAEADRTKVAVAEDLAANLKLKKGSPITLLTTTKDGIANAVDLQVDQIYNTGNPGTNDKFILTNLAVMRELYDTEGADKIVVTIKNAGNTKAVQEKLVSDISKAGYQVDSKTWDEISVSYQKVRKMFTVIFRVLMVIISAIVLLTLLNTMHMTVSERTREIGALRAIGMLKKNVLRMFTIEGFLLTLIAIAIAVPLLLGLKALFGALNITFVPPVASIPVPVNLILVPTFVAPVVVLFLVVTLLSSYFAAKRIVNQQIVTALTNI